MTTSTKLMGGAIALCAGVMAAGAAGAQDYVQHRVDQAVQGETVALRWTLPFGDSRTERAAAPTLALRFSQASAEGAVQAVDLARFSFSGGSRRFESPFQANLGEGAGHWIAIHPLLATLGAGLVIWGVAEATREEDAPTNQCGSNSSAQAAPQPGGPSMSC